MTKTAEDWKEYLATLPPERLQGLLKAFQIIECDPHLYPRIDPLDQLIEAELKWQRGESRRSKTPTEKEGE